MTPKEKAQEILDAMQKVYDMSNYSDFTIDENDNQKNDELWQKNSELFGKIYKEFARQCALIAVDEIINSNPVEEMTFLNGVRSNIPYWQEVKHEIEKL